MRTSGLVLFTLLFVGCSAVYPSDDFFTDPVCGENVPRYSGSPCPPRVFTCANGCETGSLCCNDRGMCDDACIQRCQLNCLNEAPGCSACVLQNATECINANGCDAEWIDYDCCVRASCGFGPLDAPEGDTCIPTSCATEAVVYDMCSNQSSVAATCDNAFLTCAQVPGS